MDQRLLRKFLKVSLLACLLTYGAETFLRSCQCAVTQELPSILRNLKVNHCVHKSPPLVPILSQIDPVHTIPSYLSKIYFNIVQLEGKIRKAQSEMAGRSRE
jgi:hypothetical protein